MAAPLTPPPLQGPTAKEKKYDRQLRLWAASGQQALEDAHILLINAGSGVVGIETLKNLVLPGIGAFTIVDENVVEEQDLGVNFFLEGESLGKGRADECTRLLRELNPDVQGHAIKQAPADFVAQADLSKYTLILVIAPTKLKDVLQPVATAAHSQSIPLFYVHSTGFYARFSIQLPDYFPIVETHPDPVSTQDLRLLKPWPELLDFMKSKTDGLDAMSDHEHGHVPYLLLLLYHLEQWKQEHGQYPNSYKNKTAFRGKVQASARTSNAEGGEENFDEAAAAVLKSLSPPTVPSAVREIFNEPECKEPTADSSSFFIVAHALSEFVASTGTLPLPGAVPDMKAQSADYIALQNVYRSKSQKDIAAVLSTVREVEKKLQRSKPIDAKEIEAFCKGAAWVKLIRGRALKIPDRVGHIDWADREKMVIRELQDESSLMALNVALLALDATIENLNVKSSSPKVLLAACHNESFKGDFTARAIGISNPLLADAEQEDAESVRERLTKLCAEIVRTGPVEMHNIASLAGGMVAQEVIKAVTKQYVPVDNTCIFDGIASKAGVFKL